MLQMSGSRHGLSPTFTPAVHCPEIPVGRVVSCRVVESSKPGAGIPWSQPPPLPRAWHQAWLLLRDPHLALKLRLSGWSPALEL